MNNRVLDLIVDGGKWLNIKKVIPLSPGDSICEESSLHNVLWQMISIAIRDAPMNLAHIPSFPNRIPNID